jgi:hypothetical protein
VLRSISTQHSATRHEQADGDLTSPGLPVIITAIGESRRILGQ